MKQCWDHSFPPTDICLNNKGNNYRSTRNSNDCLQQHFGCLIVWNYVLFCPSLAIFVFWSIANFVCACVVLATGVFPLPTDKLQLLAEGQLSPSYCEAEYGQAGLLSLPPEVCTSTQYLLAAVAKLQSALLLFTMLISSRHVHILCMDVHVWWNQEMNLFSIMPVP